MQADEALPRIKEVLKDRDLAKQAAVAWAISAKRGIPVLVEMLDKSQSMGTTSSGGKRSWSARGTHGDSSVVPPLLEKLQKVDTDWIVLTEVAWSLGRIPDKQSIQPLYELDKRLQSMREPDNQPLKKLKEAAYWAIKQCDTWDQYS